MPFQIGNVVIVKSDWGVVPTNYKDITRSFRTVYVKYFGIGIVLEVYEDYCIVLCSNEKIVCPNSLIKKFDKQQEK